MASTPKRELMMAAARGKFLDMPATRLVLPSAVVMVVLMCGAHAHAQCTMDRECKTDRICEKASCVDPSPAAPAVTAAPKPPASAAPTTAAPARATPRSPPSPPKQPPLPPLVPHSEDMVAAGIGAVALAGVGFILAVGS